MVRANCIEGIMARVNRADRLDRQAWVRAALKLLRTESIENVRVEPLAKELGVTKGSFYWHFKDRDDLLQEILDTWRKRATSDVIERLEKRFDNPGEAIRQVLTMSFAPEYAWEDGLIELAIRDWARRDRGVRRVLEEVDEQRLRFNTRLFKKMGLDDDLAAARGFLVYSFNYGDAIICDGLGKAEKEIIRKMCIDYLSEP